MSATTAATGATTNTADRQRVKNDVRTNAPSEIDTSSHVRGLAALARDWREELERCKRLYAGRGYLPISASDSVRDRVPELARAAHFPRRPIARPPEQPEQLALAV